MTEIPVKRFMQRIWLSRNRQLQAAFISFVVLAAATLTVYLTVLLPRVADLDERERNITRLRRDISDAILFQQQKKGAGDLADTVPTQKDMPLLVKDLVQMAKKQHIAVGTVDYEMPRTGTSGVTKLMFHFPASGRYADLKRFLFDLETSGKLVGIEDLELKSGRGVVDLDMKLITYVRGM